MRFSRDNIPFNNFHDMTFEHEDQYFLRKVLDRAMDKQLRRAPKEVREFMEYLDECLNMSLMGTVTRPHCEAQEPAPEAQK